MGATAGVGCRDGAAGGSEATIASGAVEPLRGMLFSTTFAGCGCSVPCGKADCWNPDSRSCSGRNVGVPEAEEGGVRRMAVLGVASASSSASVPARTASVRTPVGLPVGRLPSVAVSTVGRRTGRIAVDVVRPGEGP